MRRHPVVWHAPPGVILPGENNWMLAGARTGPRPLRSHSSEHGMERRTVGPAMLPTVAPSPCHAGPAVPLRGVEVYRCTPTTGGLDVDASPTFVTTPIPSVSPPGARLAILIVIIVIRSTDSRGAAHGEGRSEVAARQNLSALLREPAPPAAEEKGYSEERGEVTASGASNSSRPTAASRAVSA